MNDPIRKKVAAVRTQLRTNEDLIPATNGSSGTSPDDKRDECCEGRLIWRTELGRQAVFLREHRAHPAVLIGSYQLNRLLQLFSFKALFSIDLADLIAFALGRNSNVAILDPFQSSKIVRLCPRAEVIAGSHRKTVGGQIGKAEDEHDRGRQFGAGNAGHDSERRNRSVDAAVNEIADLVVISTCQPVGNRFGRVSVFEVFHAQILARGHQKKNIGEESRVRPEEDP